MSTFEDLKRALDELNLKYPRPNLPAGTPELGLTDPLDIVKHPEASWPSNQSAGVYILMDAKQELLYIGKASFSNIIGGRLNKRFDAKWNPIVSESQGTRFVTTIALPSGHEFEAAAIEEFLLTRLSTQHNKIGICQQPPAGDVLKAAPEE